MTKNNLEPILPVEAKNMHLEARKQEVSQSTLDGYHYRLKHFIRWCEEVERIGNMNDLSGRDLQRYKSWRRDDGDLKPISLEGQLDALRIFTRSSRRRERIDFLGIRLGFCDIRGRDGRIPVSLISYAKV